MRRNQLRFLKISSRKPRHLCPEWDYLEISPGDPEMEVCVCDFPSNWRHESVCKCGMCQYMRDSERALRGLQ